MRESSILQFNIQSVIYYTLKQWDIVLCGKYGNSPRSVDIEDDIIYAKIESIDSTDKLFFIDEGVLFYENEDETITMVIPMIEGLPKFIKHSADQMRAKFSDKEMLRLGLHMKNILDNNILLFPMDSLFDCLTLSENVYTQFGLQTQICTSGVTITIGLEEESI